MKMGKIVLSQRIIAIISLLVVIVIIGTILVVRKFTSKEKVPSSSASSESDDVEDERLIIPLESLEELRELGKKVKQMKLNVKGCDLDTMLRYARSHEVLSPKDDHFAKADIQSLFERLEDKSQVRPKDLDILQITCTNLLIIHSSSLSNDVLFQLVNRRPPGDTFNYRQINEEVLTRLADNDEMIDFIFSSNSSVNQPFNSIIFWSNYFLNPRRGVFQSTLESLGTNLHWAIKAQTLMHELSQSSMAEAPKKLEELVKKYNALVSDISSISDISKLSPATESMSELKGVLPDIVLLLRTPLKKYMRDCMKIRHSPSYKILLSAFNNTVPNEEEISMKPLFHAASLVWKHLTNECSVIPKRRDSLMTSRNYVNRNSKFRISLISTMSPVTSLESELLETILNSAIWKPDGDQVDKQTWYQYLELAKLMDSHDQASKGLAGRIRRMVGAHGGAEIRASLFETYKLSLESILYPYLGSLVAFRNTTRAIEVPAIEFSFLDLSHPEKNGQLKKFIQAINHDAINTDRSARIQAKVTTSARDQSFIGSGPSRAYLSALGAMFEYHDKIRVQSESSFVIHPLARVDVYGILGYLFGVMAQHNADEITRSGGNLVSISWFLSPRSSAYLFSKDPAPEITDETLDALFPHLQEDHKRNLENFQDAAIEYNTSQEISFDLVRDVEQLRAEGVPNPQLEDVEQLEELRVKFYDKIRNNLIEGRKNFQTILKTFFTNSVIPDPEFFDFLISTRNPFDPEVVFKSLVFSPECSNVNFIDDDPSSLTPNQEINIKDAFKRAITSWIKDKDVKTIRYFLEGVSSGVPPVINSKFTININCGSTYAYWKPASCSSTLHVPNLALSPDLKKYTNAFEALIVGCQGAYGSTTGSEQTPTLRAREAQ